MKTQTVSDVMTKSPHTIGADQPLVVARDTMRKHAIRHLPVMKGGQLAGVISDRDIDFALRVEKNQSLHVDDAFTAEVYTVPLTASLAQVSTDMAEQRIGCALVVNDRQQLMGIFTAVDACRVLGEYLRK